MVLELMKLRAGMDTVHIPYKGTRPAMSEQIAGQVQVGSFNLIAGMSVVQSGRLRGLAVSGANRATRLPDVPTSTEIGFRIGFQSPIFTMRLSFP